MTVTSVACLGGPMLEFHTGPREVRFNRPEVMELIDALNGWLVETANVVGDQE
jgi:hypothetical protein